MMTAHDASLVVEYDRDCRFAQASYHPAPDSLYRHTLVVATDPTNGKQHVWQIVYSFKTCSG